jgi:hypothetical protein
MLSRAAATSSLLLATMLSVPIDAVLGRRLTNRS